MDVNATLEELRALAARRMGETDDWREWSAADTDRMAELVQALDGWITRGNFPPAAWASHDVREIR